MHSGIRGMLQNAFRLTTQIGRCVFQQRSLISVTDIWNQSRFFCTVSDQTAHHCPSAVSACVTNAHVESTLFMRCREVKVILTSRSSLRAC